jgi:hypothetical protein
MNTPTNRPEWIWSIESVFEFLNQADEALALPINTDSGEEVADRIAEFVNMFSASANVMAACKWYEQAAIEQVYREEALKMKDRAGETYKSFVSPSVLNKYIAARTAEFQALYTRAERTNAAITHSMEGLRSILSKLKVDKQIENYATNLR